MIVADKKPIEEIIEEINDKERKLPAPRNTLIGMKLITTNIVASTAIFVRSRGFNVSNTTLFAPS